jgi:hypothetical protein
LKIIVKTLQGLNIIMLLLALRLRYKAQQCLLMAVRVIGLRHGILLENCSIPILFLLTTAATECTLFKAISQIQVNQRELLDELKAVRRTQHAILSKLNSPDIEELPSDIQLPLTTHEGVDELEEKLKDKKGQ